MTNYRDKRKYKRIESAIELTFSDGERLYTDSIKNISIGGVCVECHKPIKRGQQLKLVIPTMPPLKIGATVRWSRRNGLKHLVGMEFDPMLPEQHRTLSELFRASVWDTAIARDKF